MNYLTNSEYEDLHWREPFGYPNMVRIRTFFDGSCFFHAIARSYFKPYITGKLNGKVFDRTKFIRDLRHSLSIKLGSKQKGKLTYYDTLSRGQLAEIAKTIPAMSLTNMQNELNSSRSVSNIYNEFISDQLDKDIYILDGVKRDVYMMGDDDEILYKHRPSIVLLYLPSQSNNHKEETGHYELVGLQDGDNIRTLFDPTDEFIGAIRYRMMILRS